MKKNFTLSVCLFMVYALVALQEANAQTTTINWGGTNGLNTSGGSQLSGTKYAVVVGTKTVDISYAITYTGNAPTFSPNGGGNVNRNLSVDWGNLTSAITLTVTFSSPVAITNFPINNVGYDNDGGSRHNDRVEITGSNGGNTTANILQFGANSIVATPSTAYPDLTASSSTFAQNLAGAPSIWVQGENANNSTESDNISFITNSTLQGVSKVVIVYRSGTVGGGETNPNAQSILLAPFTISAAGASNAPLPVNFANVNAKENGGKVAVSWSNLTESDINYYEVERSTDGKLFAGIGKVQPKANDYSKQDYSFVDANAGSVAYYRVKAVEFNNSSKISVILKVSNEKSKKQFSVYPNPVQNKVVTIQGSNISAGVYSIQVMNANGQQVFAKSVSFQAGAISQSIELPASVKPGTYLLKIQNTEVSSVTTLFVQ